MNLRRRVSQALSTFDSLGGMAALLNAFTLLTLGLTIARVPHWLSAVLAAWCMFFLLRRMRGGLPIIGRGKLIFATYPVTRTALAAVAAEYSMNRQPDGPGVIGWIALALLCVVAVSEPVVRKLSGGGGIRRLIDSDPVNASGLPGIDIREKALFDHNLVTVTALFGLILAGLASLLDGTYIPALLLAIISLGLLGYAAYDYVEQADRHRGANDRIREGVRAHAPTFALYWSAAPNTSYQIQMWLPYLERLGKPFIIIVRSKVNFNDARAVTSVPVILRTSTEQLDEIIVPSLKAVFYVNNAGRNLQMVRYPQLKHIQLNHGDSDKAPSFNPAMRMYDRDFVAGQAAIDRFAANGVWAPDELFTIVGRPQVEDVKIATKPIATIEHPTVLYAPTWAGFTSDAQYSSLGVGVRLVKALLERGANVVFRPHPYARRTPAFAKAINEICALLSAGNAAGAQHVFGKTAEEELTLVDCFNRSDAMISDVSSVVADFLYSEKPMAAVAVSTSATKFPDEFPLAKASYIIDAHKGRVQDEDLQARLDEMLGSDPLADVRHTLKAYYLGDFGPENYADHFLDAAREFI